MKFQNPTEVRLWFKRRSASPLFSRMRCCFSEKIFWHDCMGSFSVPVKNPRPHHAATAVVRDVNT